MNAQTAKITPGVWVAQKDPNAISRDDWCIGVEGAPIDYVATCSERDAHLIAEAGTVANETGLTPQQLADQRAELLEALRQIVTRYVELVNSGDCGSWNPEKELEVVDARAAIARATGEQP